MIVMLQLVHRRTKNAFTFIELLVVIIIIGVLASMLLTSIINARKAADVAVCDNMKRQLIIYYYADDWESVIETGPTDSPSYTSQLLVRSYPAIEKACYECHHTRKTK